MAERWQILVANSKGPGGVGALSKSLYGLTVVP